MGYKISNLLIKEALDLSICNNIIKIALEATRKAEDVKVDGNNLKS